MSVPKVYEIDPFSPLNDPAGDNFHHFRGSDYDNEKLGILERYKHYNGTEGNSPVQSSTGESYTTSATNNPDVEDVNNDNTMNEYEKYYEYKVSLRPKDMVVGENYISDIVNATVELKNGKTEQVKWYQFKIKHIIAQSAGIISARFFLNRAFTLFFQFSIMVYITGTRTSVNIKELVRPPIITNAMPLLVSEPAAVERAIGNIPKIMAKVVIRIGRKRSRPAAMRASLTDSPFSFS